MCLYFSYEDRRIITALLACSETFREIKQMSALWLAIETVTKIILTLKYFATFSICYCFIEIQLFAFFFLDRSKSTNCEGGRLDLVSWMWSILIVSFNAIQRLLSPERTLSDFCQELVYTAKLFMAHNYSNFFLGGS